MLFDAREIEEYIPHREPFRLIDGILSIEEGARVTSVKEVRGEEYYFQGHFPGYPIMPGVLIIENMAQTANFLVAYSARQRGEAAEEGKRHFLGMVRKMHFSAPVRPGDDLITEVTVVKLFASMGIMDGVSRVGETVVAKGQLMFGAVKE